MAFRGFGSFLVGTLAHHLQIRFLFGNFEERGGRWF